MKHDSERHAAAYLSGLLKGARRRMFERHMMDCEDCWSEVDLGRKGRSVAESGRELTPQDLRERVRSAVEMIAPRRRRPWAFGVAQQQRSRARSEAENSTSSPRAIRSSIAKPEVVGTSSVEP